MCCFCHVSAYMEKIHDNETYESLAVRSLMFKEDEETWLVRALPGRLLESGKTVYVCEECFMLIWENRLEPEKSVFPGKQEERRWTLLVANWDYYWPYLTGMKSCI